MSDELADLLAKKNAKLSDVLQVMQQGVDPMHDLGRTVATALEKFGSKTLSWFVGDVANDYMRYFEQAWLLVSAATTDVGFDSGPMSVVDKISMVYNNDTRDRKDMSVAYLRALRVALYNNDARLAAQLAYTINYNVNTLLQALAMDCAASLRTISSYDALPHSAYANVVKTLSDISDGSGAMQAFVSLQVLISKDSMSLAANLILLTPPSANGWYWMSDYDTNVDAIEWAVQHLISNAGDYDYSATSNSMFASIGLFRQRDNMLRIHTAIVEAMRNEGYAEEDIAKFGLGRYEWSYEDRERQLRSNQLLAKEYSAAIDIGMYSREDVDVLKNRILALRDVTDKDEFLDAVDALYEHI